MKKILIDASRYQIEQPTGVEVYSNNIIDQVLLLAGSREDVEVTLIAPVRKDIGDHPQARMVVLPGRRFWTLFHLSVWMLFHKKDYDALFVPSHILPLCVPKRVVVTIHDVVWKRFPQSYSLIQRAILSLGVSLARRVKARVVIPSSATKKDMETYYSYPTTSMFVVSHGFDFDTFQKSFVNAGEEYIRKLGLIPGKYVIAIGRMETKKNTHLLVRAAQGLPAGIRLLLVGKPGQGYDEVEQALRDIDKDKVLVLGYLSNDFTYTLLKYARGLVLPSQYEGFGLTLLEAWALGTPVLCSDQGSLAEVGGNAVQYITAIDDLEQSLSGFVHDIHDKMIIRGTKRLAQFSWKDSATHTLELLLKE